jgi:hypothetical protein
LFSPIQQERGDLYFYITDLNSFINSCFIQQPNFSGLFIYFLLFLSIVSEY